MPETPRIAQPGDIFILLVPTGDDLDRLQRLQGKLQAQYGGQPVTPIHVTVERFTPIDGKLTQDCIPALNEIISNIEPFQISTDALIQFYAPYWRSYVLRWRVKETDIWNKFRDLLEITLCEVQCPSHFTRRRHASCTILKLDNEVTLPANPFEIVQPLFVVREFWVSLLTEENQFDILEKLKLR